MALTVIELFAVIFSILFILKFLFFLFNKKGYMKFAKAVYAKNNSITWLFGVLAIIVLYYLLPTMSIVQILGAGLFIVLLMGMAFAAYGSDFVKMGEKMLKGRLKAAVWINLIIWLVLSIWTLYLVYF